MKNLILIFIWFLGNAHSQTLAASAAIGITGNSVGLIRVGMEAEKILNFTKPISDKLETVDEGELVRVMRLNQNGISLRLFFDENKVRSISIYDRGLMTANGIEVGTSFVNLLAMKDLQGGIANAGLVVFSPSMCGHSFLLGVEPDMDSYYPSIDEDTPQEWTIQMLSKLPKNLVVKEIFVYGC